MTGKLTGSQQGLYLECIADPESTLYNLPFLGLIHENTDPERLKEAVLKAVAAHPALNAVLAEEADGTIVLKTADTPPEVKVFNLSDEDFAERKETLVRPFDLNGGKLARFEIYVTPSGIYLFEDVHHLVFDGSSGRILEKDVRRAVDGGEPEKENVSLFELAATEEAWLQTGEAEEALAYWRELLAGCEPGCLPERDRWEEKEGQGWLTRFAELDEGAFSSLRHRAGCSTSAFFTAAFGMLLSAFTGQEDVLFNTIAAGRDETTANTVGMLVRTLPVRMNLKEQGEVDEFLRQVQAQQEKSRGCARYPYVKLAETFGLKPEITFGYHGKLTKEELISGWNVDVERIYDENHIEAVPLLFEVSQAEPGRYRVHMGFRTDRFSSEWAESFMETYLQILRELFAKETLRELILVSNEQAEQLDAFNRTEKTVEDTDIVTLFRRAAAQHPEKTAVICGDRRLTYRELDHLSDRIAACARNLGIGPEDVVSILISRSEMMVVTALGALKAGAAYQPLDPSYPPERLQYMVKDADSRLLIADESLTKLLPEWQGPVLLTKDIETLPEGDAPDTGLTPDNLLILLYTSGTTGQPKGVMLTHRGLVNFCDWYRTYYGLTPESTVAAYASFGFDAHMMDLYPALTTGSALCIVPEEMRMDLQLLHRYYTEHHVTHVFMTTQMGRMYATMFPHSSLTYLTTGGEKLVPIAPPEGYRLFNAYGPTECTIFTTIQEVDRLYDRVPIGSPIANYKLYVADRQGRRLPVGAAGELWIAGFGVGRGYLRQPEKTAEAFIPNPFCSEPGFERVYRTGDIVRRLPNGSIDFIGRNDGQVKIRGFRIELPEVEGVIRAYPGIKDATVQAFADERTGMKYLAAYVVSDETVDVSALNDFIRERKPPYMVPAVTMQLDAIPLNQNQKVDKRALPQPRHEEAAFEAPATEAERTAFDCVAETLGHRHFGVTTDLEEAGMTSLGMMQLNMLLSKAFGRTVRTREMKELHTVRDIAAYFRVGSKENSFTVQKTYPLSSVQQGVYVECLAHPESTVYNIPLLLKLDPSVDPKRLKAALTQTIDAHPFLKARLTAGANGEILMLRNDNAVIDIETLEKSALPEGFAGLVRPFRLTEEPLIRAALIREGETCRLFLDAHHLVFDGESLVILLRDLEKAYRCETVEKESFTGFDAALDEEQLRAGPDLKEAEQYYADLLKDTDPDCLPVRDRNETEDGIGFLNREISLDRTETDRFLREGKTTVNALMNAAFGLTLSRFLGRNDCVYTTVYNGRNDSRLFDSVGMFVHTLPVVCRMNAGENGRDFVGRLGHQLSDSMANDIFSFAEISRTFGVRADILFVYEGAIGTSFIIGGKPAESEALRPDAAKAALTFFVYDTAEGFRFGCEYETGRYEEWHIAALLEGMECALKALLRNESPEKISLLTAEKQTALNGFNATEKNVEDTDIVTLFRRAAAKNPEKIAVIYGKKHLTYGELDMLSDRIAVSVRSLGIGPEDVVSILISRSEWMPVTALGALKAGAAYQPLDPGYPPERLQYMVQDAGAKLLIADESLTELLPDWKGPVLLTKDIPALPDGDVPSSGLTPENLFILLYTSGTTGQPKGVMLMHRNLVNFCDWYRTHYGLTPESTVAAYASFGFDADMMDMYPALTTGAAVCIVPEDMRLELATLNRYYQTNNVTHVFMTTQMGRMFAAQFPESSLTHLSVGGEKLTPVEPPKNYTLTNGYGPTECTVFTTTQEVDRLYDRVPIGRPLSNYKLYVVDGQGHELPPGAMGELWIAGSGVGRGYLHLPEKTAEVFIPNPFCSEKGFERVYRTGDVVRRLADGRIDFIGRNDGQVKIRGFRIELTEVEGVIREYNGIRDVTVQAFDDEGGNGKYIAAYVVADEAVDFDQLADFIRGRKPSYMVPSAFMQLDAIPLNQNQKVNKRALPKPVRREENSEYVEPATPLERELCEKYANILGLEKVGATDNFFNIGGSSISAAEIIMYAMDKGYSLVYKDVFANPSPRELARVIAGAGADRQSGVAADYDYTAINRLLAYNTMEHVEEITVSRPVGNTVLIGATGFLGIHVLRALLNRKEGKIFCLLRRGEFETVERRMKEMLMYYFGKVQAEVFGTRIFCLEGDLTDPESLKALDGLDAETLINCAASVKHFTDSDLLDRVNFHGVENLIEVCLRNGMRLVHVSTLSVGGEMETEHLTELKEDMLYIGQNVRNDYVRTKFLAERAILEARVKRGLDAVILRAGNLMGRYTDGEFQINFETNAFMRSLWAYVKLRKCPFSILERPVEFSPIDSVAEAVLKLAEVDGRFSVFHMNNNHTLTIADLMDAFRRYGFDVETVPDSEFRDTLSEAAKDEAESRTVLSLVAYSNKEGDTLQMVDSDRRFTINALFRLGFRWPIVDDGYLEKMIWALDSLDFFTDPQ
ncbi:MAG: amino acid adenylation domain-containing protein [Clostridia bacterium]